MAGRQVWRTGCGMIAAVLLGASLAVWGFIAYRNHERAQKVDDSLNGEGPIQPAWMRLKRSCKEISAEQQAQDKAVINLAIAFAGNDATTGVSYAFKYFGWHWRIAGGVGRCPPDARYYAELAPMVDRAGWPTLRPESQFDLRLAERLPPSPKLADRLAKLAFNSYPITTEPLDYDIRPFARILLAEQGPYAHQWKERALAEIAPTTKLGTSAAYLAVAIAPIEALPRVERAMHEMTKLALSRKARNSDGAGVNTRDGYRLYELAYALSMAGPAARPYGRPLVRLLDQKFATGSHFGLLMLDPVALCDVAQHIGGQARAAANSKLFCIERLKEKTASPLAE